ncbi:DarT ssDNA thymidine ADP-ribosyltransferase family protein [Brevundimonas sp.]|jgi:hypothetical protein|uniref:DarT ssDNA thymidine ADP-ribosyltransferase family protein n=1 Tax=Brevundimonas sp. TaxID=1871086 RepID=UPI00391D12A2
MGLTAACARAHIEHWTNYYSQSYRTKWPSRLFHHAPLENALEILRSGLLQSRKATQGLRAKDVAAVGVIGTNDVAHDSVRCYFRPRTPTQFHIEGIRKDSDCQLGVNAHAPVLVMFVLHAEPILTLPATRFSDRNMQKGGVRVGDDDEFFASIPFELVYHEGAYSQDQSEIKDRRAAEVLITSPLQLERALQWVLCRSDPERDTLLYLLGQQADHWRAKVLVSDDIKVFQKSYPFVQHASLSNAGFIFQVNPRPDRGSVAVVIDIWNQETGQHVANFTDVARQFPPPTSARWIYRTPIADGRYRVRMTLEGHLAYEAVQEVGGHLF